MKPPPAAPRATATAGLFDCKPLEFLWRKFEGMYGAHNTIMFDDLRRNYIMNSQVWAEVNGQPGGQGVG